MAGELNLKYPLTGKTILALIIGEYGAVRWNGTEMVSIPLVSNANWMVGMVQLTEMLTLDGTPTGIYFGDFPSEITDADEYHVQFYLSTAAAPNSPAIGVQDIWWDGQQKCSPADVIRRNFGNGYVKANVTQFTDDAVASLSSRLTPFEITSGTILPGSTRTVWNVDCNAPFMADALKGLTAVYRSSAQWGMSFPVLIVSNTEFEDQDSGHYVGTITLAGNGNYKIPEENDGFFIICSNIAHPQSGDAFARLGTPAGASVSADIAAKPTASQNATAVWSAGTRSLTTFGTLTTDVANAVWSATTRTLTSFGSLIADIWNYATRTITGGTINTYAGNTPQTGDAFTRLGAPTGASISADIATKPTANQNASAVWSAETRSLTTFGTLAADVASAVWSATTRTLTGLGTLVADIWSYATRTITGGTINSYTGNTPQTGDSYARLGAPAGASVSADIASVKTKTDKIPDDPAREATVNSRLAADCYTPPDNAKIAAIKTQTDKIPNEPAAVGSAMTLQPAERQAIATALLDLASTIDGKTLRQALQIISAVLAGKVSGAGSGTETFRSLDDQHNRVVVTADANGNRTNITYQ